MALAVATAGAFPKPSPYPISWELKFDYGQPKRVVVTPPGSNSAQAYWYMTFTVTNLGDAERRFIPVLEMLTESGQVIRSDGKRYESIDGEIREVKKWIKVGEEVKEVPELIPPVVLEMIRAREKNPRLESVTEIASTIRLGEDQAREAVAIWPEPTPEMGRFTIFVTGLSGEAVVLSGEKGEPVMRTTKDGKKEPIILRKTLALTYQMYGDDQNPGGDPVEAVSKEWVMR
jgi:hypothetical protein